MVLYGLGPGPIVRSREVYGYVYVFRVVPPPTPLGEELRTRWGAAQLLLWPIGLTFSGNLAKCRVCPRGVSSRNVCGPLGRACARPIGRARLRANKRRGIRGKSLVTSFYSLELESEHDPDIVNFHVVLHNSLPFWLKLGGTTACFSHPPTPGARAQIGTKESEM